jgi:threonine/homoserine/homoserine lactone efflux protein
MSNGLRYGYRKTLRFLMGIFCGVVVMMLLCGLLNYVLLSLLPQVKFWLNIFGAVYMLYLAVHIILSKPVVDKQGDSKLNTFAAGFIMQFLNLKVILYGITIYSNFIIQAFQNPLTVSLFAPLLAIICFISISCWAIGGNFFRRFLSKYSLAFNLVMGALLIYTAVASLL